MIGCIIYKATSALIYNYRVSMFLTKQFQVISRFCPDQSDHSPGFCVGNVGTKRQLPTAFKNCRSAKLGKSLSQYNIKMLYISTFKILSMFSATFIVLSRFSHFWGQNLGYFWTWTNSNIQVPLETL